MTSRPPTASPDPAVYLVAVDGTPSDTHVLEVACGLGATLGGAAELHIVHVLGGPVLEGGVMTPGIVRTEEVEAEDRLALDRSTAYAAAHFPGQIAGHLASGEPWRAIVQLAASLSVDLVVVGTAGLTGLTRMLLGSVAEEVVRHAGCPVLVVRPKDHHSNAHVRGRLDELQAANPTR